ncbi:hypothetical protein A3742_12320 [Oleiphilus sp. HI0071]|uniref:DUF4381 domain-containing protein n=1 Tax=unclassified Oleiphilus TaxID=2631174 RepID=UPI0007C30C39|nr:MULTISPECIES: DUF4381 domain-containing protein [unclassified Oleiphilus]KZY61185.1 hypothetical protein A3737_22410 [Oleiphilus sp. HI0065]KZY80843.1 hypothetical protein A3742_12320 [Oleiphilus sp. HI0071]KZY91230.1 hypothetical protein A3744_05075 [Oleiphilus sp. HI0073]KZZ42253.1 hypothetical protein A3758_06720 [Oleiphilus sp. HI0118]KZZ60300.1 hypothetical protein A3760_05350 [Oleiphilus sp. HI0122]KZZ64427.1 hypothetical protein A3765_07095 [Oleiphilus sp. HI0130]KZZ78255.1 hypothe
MESVDESFANTFGNYILHGINEVVLPQSVSWFPQTIGWQIMFFVALLCILVKCASLLIRWYYNRYRSEALKVLDAAAASGDRLELSRKLPEVLKATALQAYSREMVAPLSGDAWVAFLNRTSPTPCFDSETGKLLARLAYERVDNLCLSETQLESLLVAVKHWIESHQTTIPRVRDVLRHTLFGRVDA